MFDPKFVELTADVLEIFFYTKCFFPSVFVVRVAADSEF